MDYEVEYQIKIRSTSSLINQSFDVLYYGIENMYRGHSFFEGFPRNEIFYIDDEIYSQEKEYNLNNLNLKVKLILEMTDSISPKYVEWAEVTLDDGTAAYFDAYLIHCIKIE